jgi:putative FmdB family regulatory protein
MPTYEYECEKTGKHFEKFQSMKDAPLAVCPECGGPVHRLLGGGVGVIFKGAGFHATDDRQPAPRRPSCGRDGPCCGRSVPCDTPSCKE